MTYIKNENITAESLSQLIDQFKDATNLNSLVTLVVKDNEDFEDSTFAMHSSASIATAVGAQLDVIGELLATPRLGRLDNVYRPRLYAAVVQFTSSGRWEQIVEGFRLLTGARSTQGGEIFPAGIDLTAVGAENLSTIDLNEISAALKQMKAAGILLNAALVIADPPFVFGGDPDPLGQGFADENNYATTGGYFPLTLII